MATKGTNHDHDHDPPDSSGDDELTRPVTERTPGSNCPAIERAGERRKRTEAFVASPTDGSPEVPGLEGWSAQERRDCARPVLLELRGAQPGAVFRIQPPSALIGRSASAEVALEDTTVSFEHARLTLAEHQVQVEDLASRNGTFANGRRVSERTTLTDGDYLSVGGFTLFKFSMIAELEEQVLRTLFELAQRDTLTGLYNRRYFDDRLRSEFLFASRQATPLGLLFIDIDRFKRVNDTRGHPTGDVVLKLVADSIQRMMRPEDVLVRYGGEEFVAIVRATSFRNLEILGNRVCRRVQALARELTSHDLVVTASVGVSYMDLAKRCDSADALLALADRALYEAKARGGNQVCLAS